MTDRTPLVEEEDVLDERGNWVGTQLRYLGLTGTQIRGLKEFYTQLTGRADGDIPEIGAIRSDMAKLLGRGD